MELETLKTERKDHLLVVRLNRPERLNAINTQMAREMAEVFREAKLDRDIWVVVLLGEGGRAFSVGADLKERMGMKAEEMEKQRQLLVDAFHALSQVDRPVVAGVRGYALGGGFELVLTADIVLAAEDAQFGFPEVSLGVIPGCGGTQRLPRIVGLRRAKEIILSARRFGAQEALEMGLVNRVVPPVKLVEETMGVARSLLENAPLALREAKRAIDRGVEVDLESGLQMEVLSYNVCLKTEDRDEGLAAFNEKRKPRWKGR